MHLVEVVKRDGVAFLKSPCGTHPSHKLRLIINVRPNGPPGRHYNECFADRVSIELLTPPIQLWFDPELEHLLKEASPALIVDHRVRVTIYGLGCSPISKAMPISTWCRKG